MARKDERIVTVGMTGASGAQYGLRLVECLIKADYGVYLMFTKAAQIVVGSETDCKLPGRTAEQTRYLSQLYGARDGQLRVFGDEEWTSPVASGSGAPLRMVVCPASMATVSAIATGASENLLERAADVVIKERGNLVIVPRETPFSAIHLENMLKLSRLDVTILPANPGFYNRPARVEELVDFIVARVLDQFDIEHDLMKRWG
ncbi:MAG: UbiX family flavin prenyltransferase [Gammaproteobacteria bacterium]|jgi:flavin prenyltransferase|nr:UbiX family flavin prenyltransferase [Gammaproteobacteria bacterium]NBP07134.1 UbiX family flavin prenyltransferase [Gammaproteobacteria bacterium]NBR16698.1 UbiX family flavin prenyltransferase [Gammaproteobacteria bacterium]NCW21861.1 UbiX family flavin prenyltransferase [Gammaproteobacteria bacterium]NCW57556.1 UbiX family flavin prenyltransferase [Gammaproteobacteria bacterium]